MVHATRRWIGVDVTQPAWCMLCEPMVTVAALVGVRMRSAKVLGGTEGAGPKAVQALG